MFSLFFYIYLTPGFGIIKMTITNNTKSKNNAKII